MTRTVSAFVNAHRVEVPETASAIDAVRAWSESAAESVEAGLSQLTDSRGLPVDRSARVTAGAIFRLTPVRERGGAAGSSQ